MVFKNTEEKGGVQKHRGVGPLTRPASNDPEAGHLGVPFTEQPPDEDEWEEWVETGVRGVGLDAPGVGPDAAGGVGHLCLAVAGHPPRRPAGPPPRCRPPSVEPPLPIGAPHGRAHAWVNERH